MLHQRRKSAARMAEVWVPNSIWLQGDSSRKNNNVRIDSSNAVKELQAAVKVILVGMVDFHCGTIVERPHGSVICHS